MSSSDGTPETGFGNNLLLVLKLKPKKLKPKKVTSLVVSRFRIYAPGYGDLTLVGA